MSATRDLQAKVDGFLREALAQSDPELRATLLGKAVYWNKMAQKAARPPQRSLRDPWADRGPDASMSDA